MIDVTPFTKTFKWYFNMWKRNDWDGEETIIMAWASVFIVIVTVPPIMFLIYKIL